MNKNSVINSKGFFGTEKNNIGMNPPIKGKDSYNPNTGEYISSSDLNNSKVRTEEEKEKNDFDYIKALVRNYESIGRQQTQDNYEDIIRNFRIANGVLNKEDFFSEETIKELCVEQSEGLDDNIDLEAFPLAPNILNTLVNHLGFTKTKYNIFAINPEAQSELIEKRTTELRNTLVGTLQSNLEQQLVEQGITEESEMFAQQMEMFQKLPKIQNYYQKEFKFDVERWSDIKLRNGIKKHNFKQIEKTLFRNKLVCDRPYIHLNLSNDDVTPEVIRPENLFYLRSPNNEDICYSTMVGWYSYETVTEIISKHPNISKDLADKVNGVKALVEMTNYDKGQYDTGIPSELINANNFKAFRNKRVIQEKSRPTESNNDLIEKLTMYMQVPRMLHILYMAIDGVVNKTIVDDSYKITYKPIFEKDRPKDPKYLIEGEFIVPFFINECYKIERLNIGTAGSVNNKGVSAEDKEVWLTVQKLPVQISDPKISKYGSIIPVFGGPNTNNYTEINSIIDRIKPWELFHTYLWNRNKQILETELGVFLLLNQNAIPKESMGETWGRNNFVKWALVARDLGVAPLDTSATNTGGTNLSASAGFGQKVDMTRIDEVLQKVKLAEICKRECLAAVGLPPQMLEELTPNHPQNSMQSQATGSVTQLSNLYEEHSQMMTRVYQAYIEMEKYLSVRDKKSEEVFITDEGERLAMKFIPDDFPLYQLGIYVTADYQESLLLGDIKSLVLNDNTMGADLQEKVNAITSDSIVELHGKLSKLSQKKQAQIQEQRVHESQMQQQQLEAQNQQLQITLAEKSKEAAIQRQHEINLAQVKAVGQTNFGEANGIDDIIKLNALQDKREGMYRDSVIKDQELRMKQDIARNKADAESNKADVERSKVDISRDIEMAKLDVKRSEIMADLAKKKMELEIARVNK